MKSPFWQNTTPRYKRFVEKSCKGMKYKELLFRAFLALATSFFPMLASGGNVNKGSIEYIVKMDLFPHTLELLSNDSIRYAAIKENIIDSIVVSEASFPVLFEELEEEQDWKCWSHDTIYIKDSIPNAIHHQICIMFNLEYNAEPHVYDLYEESEIAVSDNSFRFWIEIKDIDRTTKCYEYRVGDVQRSGSQLVDMHRVTYSSEFRDLVNMLLCFYNALCDKINNMCRYK